MGFSINKLVIIGVGLIGGSFALALREARAAGEIVGIGRTAGNLDAALKAGVVDAAATDIPSALKGADVVLLAVPVGQMGAAMQSISPYLEAHTVITDAGSTKGDVIALAREHLGRYFHHFVPAHPIAGAEHSGVAAAKADLFRDKSVIITPLPETQSGAMLKVKQLWQACGAVITEMQPQLHDEVFAAVSHLPHLLAFALVDEIARRPDAAELFQFAAGGFRDFTRIAGSSPEMWRDISMANRVALLKELDAFQAQLSHLRQLLAAGNSAELEKIFAHARAARQQWLADKS